MLKVGKTVPKKVKLSAGDYVFVDNFPRILAKRHSALGRRALLWVAPMRPRPAAPSRQSAFETILSELDEPGGADFFRPVAGVERLWTESGDSGVYRAAPVENFYAENQEPDRRPARVAPEELLATKQIPATEAPMADKPDFARIATEIAAADLDQLRHLRRRCALAAHPDRVAPNQRADAERLMALVNASIDNAMRDRRKLTMS